MSCFNVTVAVCIDVAVVPCCISCELLHGIVSEQHVSAVDQITKSSLFVELSYVVSVSWSTAML